MRFSLFPTLWYSRAIDLKPRSGQNAGQNPLDKTIDIKSHITASYTWICIIVVVISYRLLLLYVVYTLKISI